MLGVLTDRQRVQGDLGLRGSTSPRSRPRTYRLQRHSTAADINPSRLLGLHIATALIANI
jgi:hypothetical protein